MKHIGKIIFMIIGLVLVFSIHDYADQQDVCHTITGCFALYLWFQFKNP